MRARRRSNASSLRVRFLGSDADRAHQGWFRLFAEEYDRLYDSAKRDRAAYLFFHDLFRRHGPVRDVLDVACGTFSVDLPLVKRGYRVVGRDLSGPMLKVARRNLRAAGKDADLQRADMRQLALGRTFDAVLCLGTAFNYLVSMEDVTAALKAFRRHLRPGGLLVLDTTNFDAWIHDPKNASVELDYSAPNGTRIAVFAFNDQDLPRRIHQARLISAVQSGRTLHLSYSEAPLRMWDKGQLGRSLESAGFRPIAWAGDLRLGSRYVRMRSPRLVVVAERA